jgi:allantoinase
MSTGPEQFDYPHRGHGYDHDRFVLRYRDAIPRIDWPGGARLALWVVVQAQHFPLDAGGQPVMPVGGLERPYPDIWNYTLRDYGNRIGIFRLMRVLEARGLRPSVTMNAALARRYPALVQEIAQRGWEVVASGQDMGHPHHAGLAEAEERALVQDSLATLRGAFGAIAGWHSPAHAQSARTLDLLAEAGIAYVADWVNDDMPYALRTAHGPLTAMPLNHEWADWRVLVQQNRSEAEYEAMVLDAFRTLHAEAGRRGGRILCLPVTPWVMGQPYRIRTLARILDTILSHAGVWPATGAEILAAWTQATAA